MNLVGKKLGFERPCTTATTVLPQMHEAGATRFHTLRGRLAHLEHGETPGALICECEMVTAPQIEDMLEKESDVVSLNDLRRDLRLGMGPCQGGFCSFRATALRHEMLKDTPAHSHELLTEFVERRFGGIKPLLWGHNLRQALLAEHIYGRILRPDTAAQRREPAHHARHPNTSQLPIVRASNGKSRKIVVVAPGLAGLTAALAALDMGARVEVVSAGQGALSVYPVGWKSAACRRWQNRRGILTPTRVKR